MGNSASKILSNGTEIRADLIEEADVDITQMYTRIPKNFDHKKPFDFVLYFHGDGGHPKSIIKNKTLGKKIDAAANAILVSPTFGIGKEASGNGSKPKHWQGEPQLILVFIKKLAAAKNWSLQSLLDNFQLSIYGFSAGGGSMTQYFVNTDLGLRHYEDLNGDPDDSTLILPKLKHIQFNDGVYRNSSLPGAETGKWDTAAVAAIKYILTLNADTSIYFYYRDVNGSTKKAAKYMKAKLQNVQSFSIKPFNGSHSKAMGFLETSTFLTQQDVESAGMPANAPQPDKPPPPPAPEEPVGSGSRVYPKVIILPLKQEEIFMQTFAGESGMAEFKYYGKFVFFGEDVELGSYAATAKKAKQKGASKPLGAERIYWFGEFDIKAGSAMSKVYPKALKEAKATVIKEKIAGPQFKFVLDLTMIYKNTTSTPKTDKYRWFAYAPLSALLLDGNPRVKFESDMVQDSPKKDYSAMSPSKHNFSRRNSLGNYQIEVRLMDIDLYAAVATRVLQNLDERIKYYEIRFDSPFDALYYANLLPYLESQIKQILSSNNHPWNGNHVLNIEFKPDFKEALGVRLYVQDPTDTSKISIKELKIEESAFRDSMVNSLIYNLAIIYNQYSVSAWRFKVKGGGFSVFTSAEQVKSFINNYFVPKPSIVISAVTRTILEKFILGDVRLLDPEVAAAYQVSRENIPHAFKQNLNQEIANQYEAIGDFLGLKWELGEFKDIYSLQDLYDQLLNYISIPDLIKLAAKCLLKMLPLDQLLEKMCREVLNKFDEHRTAIISALEDMDDGLAKDLASELTQIYFQGTDEFLETAGEMIVGALNGLDELIQNSIDDGSWSSVTGSDKMITGTRSTIVQLIKALGVDSISSASPNLNDDSIMSRKKTLELRRDDLDIEIIKLNEKLKVFQGNIPPHQQQNLGYYAQEKNKIVEQIGKYEAVIDNIIDQLRLYNMLLPGMLRDPAADSPAGVTKTGTSDNLAFIKKVLTVDAQSPGFTNILPHLLNLNPYITEPAEKEILFRRIYGKVTPLPTPKESMESLKKFNNFWGTKGNFNNTLSAYPDNQPPASVGNFKFTFTDEYVDMPDSNKEKRQIFDLNLINVQIIYKCLRHLNNPEENGVGSSSPFHFQQTMAGMGYGTIDEYFNQLFESEEFAPKRYKLCLAIYAAVPAIVMLVNQLINDPSPITGIWDGLVKRWQIFTRMDYPVNDILTDLLLALVDIGKNLGRDLIIHGMMMVLDRIREACSEDEDKINAPYNPMGAVDLSSFIINSSKGGKEKTGDVGLSDSYDQVRSMAPDITSGQFQNILANLSGAFSIKEMCSLLKDRASNRLYLKAISILDSDPTIQGTDFHRIYASEAGIKQLFKLLSKDINPSFCEQAIANYEKEKSMLLEICFGRDDSVLENVLCKNLTPEECLNLLAKRASIPVALTGRLVAEVDNLFGEQKGPEPCADGSPGIFHESQKHSSDMVGDAIFGGIEKSFEADIGRIKDIYLDSLAVMGSAHAGQGNKVTTAAVNDDKVAQAELKKQMNSIATSKNKVAVRILLQVRDELKEMLSGPEGIGAQSFRRYSNEQIDHLNDLGLNAPHYQHISYNNSSFKETGKIIKFNFNPDMVPNNTILEIQQTPWTAPAPADGDDGGEEPDFDLFPEDEDVENLPDDVEIGGNTLARYTANKFEFIENIEERSPDHVLFGTNTIDENGVVGIAASQPDYGDVLGAFGNNLLRPKICKFVFDSDHYMVILNSIYKDLFATAFKSALYDKEEFIKLELNKKVTIEKCFLGFMNKKVLNKQMQRLTESLICYAPESATKSAPNVAMIKMALDCIIRIITVKEIMKSLFVYGIFPTEFVYDKERSLYDQFLNSEIEKAVERTFATNKNLSKEDFYNDVIQGFIVDIIRIMYQDKSISNQQAYNIIKDGQVNFVKSMMIDTVSDDLADKALNQVSEYQLLSDVLNPEWAAAEGEGEDPKKYIESLETMDWIDKLQLLQNDNLTLYMNGIQFYDDPTLNSPTAVGFTFPMGDDMSSHLPTFYRSANQEIEYYDYELLQMSTSADLQTVTQGIENGIVLERMVETKFNKNFITSKSLNVSLINFLIGLGSSAFFYPDIENPEKNFNLPGGMHPRTVLRNFLYETKLIMLFPQLKDIIDSFPDANGIWTKLLSGKTVKKEFTEEVCTFDEDGNELDCEFVTKTKEIPAGFDLFARMYIFNFQISNDVVNDVGHPEITSDIQNTFEIINNEDARKHFNWELGGKMHLIDFETLINNFPFPYYDPDSIPDSAEIANGAFIARQKPADFSSANVSKKYKADNFQPDSDWTHTSLQNMYHISKLEGWSAIDFSAPASILSQTEWMNPGQNFWEWFFNKPVNEIIEVNTLLRLVSYIKPNIGKEEETILKLKEAIFEGGGGGWEGWQQPYFTAALLENKIGHYVFGGKDNVTQYTCTPLFEVKTPIPNDITWYNFFLDLNKHNHLFDGFYAPLYNGAIGLDWKPNDIMFLKNSTHDVFSYFHRFKAITGLSTKKQKKIFVTKYQSTQWWNIRRRFISKETILEHVYNAPPDGDIPENYYGPKLKFSTYKDFDNEPYCYLTADSYASLIEDHMHFLDPDNPDELSKECVEMDLKCLDGGGNYDLSGKKIDEHWSNWNALFTKTDSLLGNDAGAAAGVKVPSLGSSVACKTGTWDITNPNTGKIVMKDAPKFIMVRDKYISYKKKSDNKDGKYGQKPGEPGFGFEESWIDYGWWYPVNSAAEEKTIKLAQNLNAKYPGAGFDARMSYDLESIMMHPNACCDWVTDPTDDAPNFDAPWRYWHVDDIENCTGTKLGINFSAWAPGFANGGLISAEKMPVELDIDLGEAPLRHNAYELFGRMLTDKGDKDLFILLLKSFFVKELSTIVAVIHKSLVEKHYPQIERNFDATIDMAVEVLLTAIATANGDYRHTSSNTSTDDFGFDVSNIDWGMITGQILKAFFGAMANTVDPTWRTQWFLPGPFTPFGIAAKLLDEHGDIFKGSPRAAAQQLITMEPKICEAKYTAQETFFDPNAAAAVPDEENPE